MTGLPNKPRPTRRPRALAAGAIGHGTMARRSVRAVCRATSADPAGLQKAPMSYLVLARKWRPKRFAELVGQEHVVRALTNALDTGRVHHAFLFTGTRGVGKTTIARIFAKSPELREGHVGRALRRVQFLPRHRCRPLHRPARDRCRQQHRRRRRARGDRQRAVHAVARAGEGLPDRRSAHAVEVGVQRAAEDAGGAAGPRQVPARHHRPAEAAGDGAVALPAVQPQAPGRGADQRPDHARSCRPKASPPSPARSASSARPPTAACATACRCWTRRSPIPARAAAASSTTARSPRCSARSTAPASARC